MKKIFFIISILIYCFESNGQQNVDDYKMMVDSAISIMYTRHWETMKKQNNDYYLKNLYLLNEQDLGLTYLPSSNKFKFIYIYDSRNKKVISKGIYAWKVTTTLNKNKLTVDIMKLYITYKKNNYTFSNGGGTQTIFEYSCEDGKWKLIAFENWGI